MYNVRNITYYQSCTEFTVTICSLFISFVNCNIHNCGNFPIGNNKYQSNINYISPSPVPLFLVAAEFTLISQYF